jgi:hypothetical protein
VIEQRLNDVGRGDLKIGHAGGNGPAQIMQRPAGDAAALIPRLLGDASAVKAEPVIASATRRCLILCFIITVACLEIGLRLWSFAMNRDITRLKDDTYRRLYSFAAI